MGSREIFLMKLCHPSRNVQWVLVNIRNLVGTLAICKSRFQKRARIVQLDSPLEMSIPMFLGMLILSVTIQMQYDPCIHKNLYKSYYLLHIFDA